MTRLLLEQRLIFPYTRDLSRHIPVPEVSWIRPWWSTMVTGIGALDGSPSAAGRNLFSPGGNAEGLPGDLCKGNGYLAVYIAGIMVGNNRITNRKEISTFMNGMIMVIPDYYCS